MAERQSVTAWIQLLREGDSSEAARQLWDRYFLRVVEFARTRLRGTARRAADEEDVALSAFNSFFSSADRFERLDNREDLWQILVMLTARKAYEERRRQQTLKRGGQQTDRPPFAEGTGAPPEEFASPAPLPTSPC